MSLKTSIEHLNPADEGLYVLSDKDIQGIHRVLSKVLSDLKTFCDEKKIRWALGGGSMLGAIRHQGFIPWDDDVDITMPRDDFDRFRAMSDEFCGGKYFLRCPGDDGFLFHFSKIYIRGTKFREVLSSDSEPHEMFIDIFVEEDCPDSAVLRRIRGLACQWKLLGCTVARVARCKKTLMEKSSHSPELRKETLNRARLSWLFKASSLEARNRKADRLFSKCRNANTRDIVIPSGAMHFFGEIYPRKWFERTRLVPFEGLEIPVPVGAEDYLARRYGEDYMKLPPESARARHALIDFELGEGNS